MVANAREDIIVFSTKKAISCSFKLIEIYLWKKFNFHRDLLFEIKSL